MSHANALLTPTGRLRLARWVVDDGKERTFVAASVDAESVETLGGVERNSEDQYQRRRQARSSVRLLAAAEARAMIATSAVHTV